LASGVPLLAALDIAKRVMGNVVLERAIDRARDGIAEGKGLAQTLARTGVIPPVLTHLIAIGEKSGDLDGMLLKAAEVFDHEAETAVNGVTSLLAPMMVLVMGLLVLFIVMAILVPIFELSEGVR
jgi:general secretion pathway protein F